MGREIRDLKSPGLGPLVFLVVAVQARSGQTGVMASPAEAGFRGGGLDLQRGSYVARAPHPGDRPHPCQPASWS